MKAIVTTHNLAADEAAGSEDACAAEVWRDSVIAVLADGVGGARFAREAAAHTVESMLANLKARPKTWSAERALGEVARLANRSLHQESLARCGRPDMLSTVAALILENGQLYAINAGDSRVYLRHDGVLRQLSEDHVESGENMKHVLRRAMGMEAEIQLHGFQAPVVTGDTVLMCSDGLSNLLPSGQLEALLRDRVTARTLVLAARELAKPETLDDISAVVVNIIDAGDARQTMLEVPATLQAGQIFDGCELIRPLNPAGRTWIARHNGGEVVIKFAPERACDDEAVRNQFAREIWSVTRFQTDFSIHGFVPPDNRTFCYCMDYLRAPTLKEAINLAPLAVPEAVALAGFLLHAAQYFHRHDLAHGDIKPENILVVRDAGQIRFKLIDFGNVTELFSETTRAGTPSFLAPERFRGAPLSERTEIFAIGVTLFLALVKKYPYGEIEPFQNPVFRSPLRLTRLDPHIPAWLESVALRAVAAEAKDRYQAYSEMIFDLQNPEQVRPWYRRDTPLLERNPLLFYKAGFFILLLISLVLLVLLMNRR